MTEVPMKYEFVLQKNKKIWKEEQNYDKMIINLIWVLC